MRIVIQTHVSRYTTIQFPETIPIPIPFQNNPKDLDPSYMTGLDFWYCFWRGRNIVYDGST